MKEVENPKKRSPSRNSHILSYIKGISCREIKKNIIYLDYKKSSHFFQSSHEIPGLHGRQHNHERRMCSPPRMAEPHNPRWHRLLLLRRGKSRRRKPAPHPNHHRVHQKFDKTASSMIRKIFIYPLQRKNIKLKKNCCPKTSFRKEHVHKNFFLPVAICVSGNRLLYLCRCI